MDTAEADTTELAEDNTLMQQEVVVGAVVVAGNFHTLDNTDYRPSLLDTVEK